MKVQHAVLKFRIIIATFLLNTWCISLTESLQKNKNKMSVSESLLFILHEMYTYHQLV